MSKRQHSKGRKRPRGWHRNYRSQHHFWRAVRRIDEAFARAVDDMRGSA
jgi:hypothetical protein